MKNSLGIKRTLMVCLAVLATSVAVFALTGSRPANSEVESGPKSQRSLSVYEFSDDKILRVYYFPAEKDTL